MIMLITDIKKDLYQLITELGYYVADNRQTAKDQWPWLLIRLNGHNRRDAIGVRYDNITLTVDIFSKYNGEKEIIEIIENISNHIQQLRKNNDNIIYIEQATGKIIDDSASGPIRKHGVVSYKFTCAIPMEDEL